MTIDPVVTTVIQPLRQTAYHLRGKLDNKLDELVQQDIKGKVERPYKLVPPIVVMRERYPIPSMEEVLQDFNQRTVFSKLNIKLAYYQIELDPTSSHITIYQTHKGMYRYKRLMFSVRFATEM